MKNILNLVITLTILALLSCGQTDPNKQIDEGNVKGETYISQEIGWTIQIPNGWNVISKDKLEANVDKGRKIIEEVAGEFDSSGLKHLISFQKNKFNIFQSTSEPFKLEYEGEWEDSNEGVKVLLYDAYTNQGIKIDTSSSYTTIDEVDFIVFHIIIYSPKGEVILYQDVYGSYINGFDFGVNLNYNNDKDKEVLMTVWKNSKFKKK